MTRTQQERIQLGLDLVLLRRRAGYRNITDLAATDVGISAKTIGKAEKGQVVSEGTIAELQDFLNQRVAEKQGASGRAIRLPANGRYPMFGGRWEDPGYLGKVEDWIEELQSRIDVLEVAVFEQEQDDEQRNTAPNTRAGASPAMPLGATDDDPGVTTDEVSASGRRRGPGPSR